MNANKLTILPHKENNTAKLYYSIGEVAEMFDVNTSLIRFWEKEFEILQPKKNSKGNRLYTADDIAKIKSIYNLVKTQGLTLEGAKKYLKGNKKEVKVSFKSERKNNEQVVSKLLKIKEQLIIVRNGL
ncbi:MAG: MerR family transcriptional regulator [Bacteroidia bacterium]